MSLMNNRYKYILLFTSFFFLSLGMFYLTNTLQKENINFQNTFLLKQAQTHFQDQVNNRKWNASYGSVYAKPKKGQTPNPYLRDNILKTADGQTLIKINPAWMTRQLSEMLETKNFHFKITSLKPINKTNAPDDFETRALTYIEKNLAKEYYEIKENSDFRYMGALVTTQSCIPCHEHQGYVIGDIRGGISINLNTQDYGTVVSYIKNKVFLLRIVLFVLLLSITALLYKQLRNNELLQEKVIQRTKEISHTKKLLQEVLDTDHSFLMVAYNTEIILANKTMLDFFGVKSLSEFKKHHKHISNAFVKVDDKDFLSTYMDKVHWINYLQKEQTNKNLKVLMRFDGEDRYFKPHTKEIVVEKQKLHIVIFDEITNELKNIEVLEEKASKDSLTKLFNRGKFDDVLSKEISIANAIEAPLSLIFLDIDYFKTVNDTHGHDIGDSVLIELAELLRNTIRKGDFVARWGGEEFIITLRSTNIARASILAEKIRESVELHEFTDGGNQTVSLGVSEYIFNESKDSLLKRVDKALYKAKESGRNRIIVQ